MIAFMIILGEIIIAFGTLSSVIIVLGTLSSFLAVCVSSLSVSDALMHMYMTV